MLELWLVQDAGQEIAFAGKFLAELGWGRIVLIWGTIVPYLGSKADSGETQC